MTVPHQALIATGDFGPDLTAQAVAAAIGGGLQTSGAPEPDLLPLPPIPRGSENIRERLDSLGFDSRMRAARAVIVADAHLRESTLAGSPTFEIATRARQAGVPAYAVTAENDLNEFDARILDLQLILQVQGTRGLRAAGRKLAGLL